MDIINIDDVNRYQYKELIMPINDREEQVLLLLALATSNDGLTSQEIVDVMGQRASTLGWRKCSKDLLTSVVARRLDKQIMFGRVAIHGTYHEITENGLTRLRDLTQDDAAAVGERAPVLETIAARFGLTKLDQ